ncbi:unnamed protein product [Linum trigynum]|uniref:DUF4216 domain-containing protein n=1 Tax=Linum trigynum TaxID=586398 RepID=A0AAV2EPR8_9ROSI
MARGENDGGIHYYGILTDIIEVCYTEGLRVVLFQCEWYDTAREGVGYKKDGHDTITINTTRRRRTYELFVLASQAIQVYYVQSLRDPNWKIVVETRPRNLFAMPSNTEGEGEEEGALEAVYQEDNILIDYHGILQTAGDLINWTRAGFED